MSDWIDSGPTNNNIFSIWTKSRICQRFDLLEPGGYNLRWRDRETDRIIKYEQLRQVWTGRNECVKYRWVGSHQNEAARSYRIRSQGRIAAGTKKKSIESRGPALERRRDLLLLFHPVNTRLLFPPLILFSFILFSHSLLSCPSLVLSIRYGRVFHFFGLTFSIGFARLSGKVEQHQSTTTFAAP